MESRSNDSIRPMAGNVNPNPTNPVNEFAQVLAAAGIEPTEIIADGELHRCPVSGRPRTKDGAYLFYADDNPSGWFQNFATGETGTWTQRRTQPLTPAERKALAARIEADKARRQAELAQAQAQARIRAERILAELPQANPEHPYLIRKGIQAAPGTKISPASLLAVPVLDPDGKPMSIQFIRPDGSKRFLKDGQIEGGFFPIKGDPTLPLHIAEGYATAASIHAATGATVLVAFNAGNLLPVAELARKYYPDREITICADDDHETMARTGKNPGLEKATAAAEAIGASLAIPRFADPKGKSDFNDLAQAEGPAQIARQIAAVPVVDPTLAAKLAAHRSVLDTATRVEEKDGVLKLIKYDNKLEMETETIVSSFKIEPIESIFIEGEGEFVKAHLQNCVIRREVLLKSEHWLTAQKFISVLPSKEFTYTGDNKTVQLIRRHLNNFEMQSKIGTRTSGFHPTEDSGIQFITEHGALSVSSNKSNLVYLNETPSGCDIQIAEPATQDELSQCNPDLLMFNSGEVSLPVLGWAVACFFKDRIQKAYKSFPLLNVEGEAGAGKSTTVREIIMRLWNISTSPKAMAEQTRFSLMKQLASTNAIPLILEENKSTKMGNNQNNTISNMIRSVFNGFEGQRGFADQSLRTYKYEAPICIVGEVGFNESAILDRIVTVYLSRTTSQHFLQNFRKIKQLPLEKLGRSLLDLSLRTDQAAVQEMIDTQLAVVSEKLSDRPRLNAAILRFSLKVLLEMLDIKETEGYMEYIDTALLNTVSEDGISTSRKSAVDRIIEYMSQMAAKAEIIKGATKELYAEGMRLEDKVHYQMEIDNRFLRLSITRAYSIFQRWASQYGHAEDVIPVNTFRKQLKSQPYCVQFGVDMKVGSTTLKCARLDLAAARARGLEVDFPRSDISKDSNTLK